MLKERSGSKIQSCSTLSIAEMQISNAPSLSRTTSPIKSQYSSPYIFRLCSLFFVTSSCICQDSYLPLPHLKFVRIHKIILLSPLFIFLRTRKINSFSLPSPSDLSSPDSSLESMNLESFVILLLLSQCPTQKLSNKIFPFPPDIVHYNPRIHEVSSSYNACPLCFGLSRPISVCFKSFLVTTPLSASVTKKIWIN